MSQPSSQPLSIHSHIFGSQLGTTVRGSSALIELDLNSALKASQNSILLVADAKLEALIAGEFKTREVEDEVVADLG